MMLRYQYKLIGWVYLTYLERKKWKKTYITKFVNEMNKYFFVYILFTQ